MKAGGTAKEAETVYIASPENGHPSDGGLDARRLDTREAATALACTGCSCLYHRILGRILAEIALARIRAGAHAQLVSKAYVKRSAGSLNEIRIGHARLAR